MALSPALDRTALAPGPGGTGAGTEHGADVPGSQTRQPGYDEGGDPEPD